MHRARSEVRETEKMEIKQKEKEKKGTKEKSTKAKVVKESVRITHGLLKLFAEQIWRRGRCDALFLEVGRQQGSVVFIFVALSRRLDLGVAVEYSAQKSFVVGVQARFRRGALTFTWI